MPDDPTPLTGVAALAEPVRRRLYDAVVIADRPLSREDAATRAGVAVHTARFHLDRLVAEGLLEVEFRRLSGRAGPGAGRPAKLYRRAPREISVSLPPRSYDLLGRILAAAVASAGGTDTSPRTSSQTGPQPSPGTSRADAGEPVARVAARIARREGERLAAGRPPGGEDLPRVADALAAGGYEPRLRDGAVRLHNCPFHRVAQEQTALVCSLNLAYVEGVCDGLGCTSVRAELAPEPEHCCVVVRSAPA